MYDKNIHTSEKVFSDLNAQLSSILPVYSFELFYDFTRSIILILLTDLIDSPLKKLRLLIDSSRVEIRISVGSEVTHYSKLYHSYNTSKKAANHLIVNYVDSLIFFDAIVEENNYIITTFNLTIDYNDIEKKICLGEKSELQDYINNIFTQISTMPKVNFAYVKLMTLEIFILFNRIYKNISSTIPDTKIIPEYLIENISNATSLDFLHTQLINLTESIDYFEEKSKYNYSPMINEILAYVHNNYFENISLKVISTKMSYNPGYLGKIFRKEVGMLFSEYVTKVKMDKAKFMLQNTNLKIADISRNIGIDNTNYFYSLFKKILQRYSNRI